MIALSVTSMSRQLGWQLPPREQLGDVVTERGVEEVPGRDVHGDLEGGAQVLPPLALGERGVDDPRRQRPDQCGALGCGDEQPWRDQPTSRVLPAQQGLRSVELLRAERQLRLEVQHQLVVVDGSAQLTQQAELVAAVLVELVVVHADLEVVLLGPVHGDVGVLQQRLDVVAVHPGQGDSHADVDVEQDAPDVQAGTQRLLHLGGDGQCRRGVRDLRQQDRELVASQPDHDVGGSHCLRQPLRHRLQDEVAVVVAERVVDLLEAVEVEQHERHRGPALARLRQAGRASLVEHRAVRQAGQESWRDW
jgi:hypothetical protein